METLPTPFCCDPCVPQGASSTPGPQGEDGTPGTNGTDGVDAFSLAVGGEVMPNDDGASSVLVTTSTSSEWMVVGQIVYVQFWGYMQVTSDSPLTLLNLADGINYATNAAPGTVLTAGARISPGGLQGPTGSTPAGALLAANDLNDVANAVTARNNLGLGDIAVLDGGTITGEVSQNSGNINNNQVVVGTATGIETRNAATVRALLGLTIGITDTDIPPVDNASGLTAGEALFATASGIESKTASAARTALGLSGTNTSMLLFQHVSNSNGGNFTSGARRTVPLNTELVDSGGYGSIAGNQITLAAGTYRFVFVVVGNEVDEFFGYLYSITGSAVITNAGSGTATYGTTAKSPVGTGTLNTNMSFGQGRFTVGGSTVIELSAECATTKATTGFGEAGALSAGGNYYYSWLRLEREG